MFWYQEKQINKFIYEFITVSFEITNVKTCVKPIKCSWVTAPFLMVFHSSDLMMMNDCRFESNLWNRAYSSQVGECPIDLSWEIFLPSGIFIPFPLQKSRNGYVRNAIYRLVSISASHNPTLEKTTQSPIHTQQ